jgi:hydroxymethylbilane synthase
VNRPVRLATRGSPLARWQAGHVASLLQSVAPGLTVEAVVVSTLGDRRLDQDIWQLGGAGVFVKEVQAAVLDGRADAAVHSAKDLPSNPALATPGLVLASVPERGDPRDALVGRSLDDLPPGARVATGSTRRRAQLADLRPDLTFTGLRGSIATRLGVVKGGEVAAVVVAAAALERLGRLDEAAEVLRPEVVVPQIGQGALAVECRVDDGPVRELLASIEHPASRRAVDAERGFLASLGGGCELPAAAHAVVDERGSARLTALLATLDGRLVLRTGTTFGPGDDPGAAGLALGEALLEDGGGRTLLADEGAVTLAL